MGRRRIFFYDIETGPLLERAWSPDQGWVSHEFLLEDFIMLTWAGRWWGEKKIYGDKLTGPEALARQDDRIVASLADQVREADLVIAHNIDRFDHRKLNARVLLNGLEPLGPTQSIDTLKLSRANFGFAHHRLDYLGHILLGEGKIKTDAQLWMDCMVGDEKALAKMYKYNRKDVDLLERVFNVMLPHVSGKGLPRLADVQNLDAATSRQCPYCGNVDLQSRGYYETNTMVYRQFWCPPANDGCGRWSRARSAEKIVRPEIVPTGR